MQRTSIATAALIATLTTVVSFGCDTAAEPEPSDGDTESKPNYDPVPCEERRTVAECEESELEDVCHWQASFIVAIDGSTCGTAEAGPGLCRGNFDDGGCEPGPETLYREISDGTFEIAVSDERCFGAPGFEQCDEGDAHPACTCSL